MLKYGEGISGLFSQLWSRLGCTTTSCPWLAQLTWCCLTFPKGIFRMPVQSPGSVKHMGGDRSETRKLLFIHVASSGFVSKSLEMPSSFLKFHIFIMKIILSFTSPKMSKTNKHFMHVSKDA